MSIHGKERDVEIDVRNVGGIEAAHHEFEPGVTVLTGENATNRTSFVKAVMAVLGSDVASVRAGTDEGCVRMRLGDEEFVRTLAPSGPNRTDATFGGTPYTDDTTAADLFAFLLGDNPTRQRVRSGGTALADVVSEPIDTEQIDADIAELRDEIDRLDERIDALRAEERRRVQLEETRQRLTAEIEELSGEIAATEEALSALDAEVTASEERRADLESAESKRRAIAREVADLEYERDSVRQQLADTREEHDRVRDRLDEVDPPGAETTEAVEAELQTVEERRTRLQDELDELGSLVEFNEGMLEESRSDVADALRGSDDDRSAATLTAQLLDEGRTVCWTCGRETDESNIARTVEVLRDYRRRKRERRRELTERHRELRSRRSDLADRREAHERLTAEVESLETAVSDLETTLETLTERIESKRRELSTAEAAVRRLETDDGQERLLELRRELSELEGRLNTKRRELDQTESRIEAAEDAREERASLQAERETLAADLARKRETVDRITEEFVDEFNDRMESILDLLDFDNVDRVWVEKRGAHAGGTDDPEFELHVVRETPDGAAVRDRLRNLSESEREVVGLVFALAGYLAHEVYEDVPFVLLDSLEAIDADRIARIVDYFSDYGTYVVVALLTEDAGPTRALDATNATVEQI
jgi:DNA repair exonuclease SbcCD ATPase subunit